MNNNHSRCCKGLIFAVSQMIGMLNMNSVKPREVSDKCVDDARLMYDHWNAAQFITISQ